MGYWSKVIRGGGEKTYLPLGCVTLGFLFDAVFRSF